MAKATDRCPPLELTAQWGGARPGIWRALDTEIAALKERYAWNSATCPLPGEAVLRCLVGLGIDILGAGGPRGIQIVPVLQTIALWRKAKVLYRFEPEMSAILAETTDISETSELPSEVLLRLPYPCVYIQSPGMEIAGDVYDGFFAYLDVDVTGETGRAPKLCFVLLTDDLRCGFAPALHINSYTLAENSAKAAAYVRDMAAKLGGKNQLVNTVMEKIDMGGQTEAAKCISTLLPYVLYLCSANADIAPSPEQRTIMRLPSAPEYTRDKYREVQRWDVGIRISTAIRAVADTDNAGSPDDQRPRSGEQSATKRPHVRRAHWHHYWRGPQNPQKGERELLLKWIAPTYINLPKEDDIDIPAVVHPVRRVQNIKNGGI